MFEEVPSTNTKLPELYYEMECAVCYCETANCNLICGHSFCFSCVKEWHHKCSEPTCPMCRKPLNFRGLHRLEEKWFEEAHNQKIDDLFGEFVEEILENCEWPHFALFEIKEAQKRLQKMTDWDFDKDLFEEIMYDFIDIVTTTSPPDYYEPRTFEHTLFAQMFPIRQENPRNANCARESKFFISDLQFLLV